MTSNGFLKFLLRITLSNDHEAVGIIEGGRLPDVRAT